MKVPARPRDTGVRFNITPLIDICFNLIVFFSLASLAARKETTEPILCRGPRNSTRPNKPPRTA